MMIENEIRNSKSREKPACHNAELLRLKKIKGQVEGVEKMIRDGRYCPEILVQLKAISSAVKAVEANMLDRHIRHCLTSAALKGNKIYTEKKIEEILSLLK